MKNDREILDAIANQAKKQLDSSKELSLQELLAYQDLANKNISMRDQHQRSKSRKNISNITGYGAVLIFLGYLAWANYHHNYAEFWQIVWLCVFLLLICVACFSTKVLGALRFFWPFGKEK